MTQPAKREQLAAMRLEDFKEHLRTNRWRIFRTNQRRSAFESIAGAQSQEDNASGKAKAALINHRRKRHGAGWRSRKS